MDIAGIYFNRGPESRLLTAPYAGIGFLEAHGLAFIIGVLMWKAAPERSWHLTALAVQALPGDLKPSFLASFSGDGFHGCRIRLPFTGICFVAADRGVDV